ncbi:MAG: PhnD/SsuA/transferrin family substrate-binding protein [Rhizobiaceae bacterium]
MMGSSGKQTAGTRAKRLGVAVVGLALIVASPASAGWQHEFGTLRIGMVSPSGGRGIAGLGQMTTAFQQAAGIPAEILVARDYPALIRAISEGRVHYAIYSAIAYGVSDALCGCVEPLAAPRGVDGAVGLRAVLLARRGAIASFDEMSGARIVAGPMSGLGPQSLALAAMADAGPAGGAVSVLHARSHSEAERQFRTGDADILVGWEPVYEDDGVEPQSGTLVRLASAGMDTVELAIIWSSATVGYGPHVVRSDLPEELKARLGRFLVNLRDQQPDVYEFVEPNRGGGFRKIGLPDYRVARQVADGIAAR